MTTFALNCLYVFLTALTFRIRGGLRIPFTDKKFPLCKWWFYIWYASLACILLGYNTPLFITCLFATYLGLARTGWGEAVGCSLGQRDPDPNQIEFYDFDVFFDNFEIQERNIKIWKWTIHIPHFKLIEHSELWGICWLTARGIMLTFFLALAIDNLLFALAGAPMGIIYWFAGWLYRNTPIKDNKFGWCNAEWIYGLWLGIIAVLMW